MNVQVSYDSQAFSSIGRLSFEDAFKDDVTRSLHKEGKLEGMRLRIKRLLMLRQVSSVSLYIFPNQP